MPGADLHRPRICFVGFGEAGQAFAAGLHRSNAVGMSAWDVRFPELSGGDCVRAGRGLNVRIGHSLEDALAGADLVMSLVTNTRSVEAARSVAAHIRPHQTYLDMNSVSPARKNESAAFMAGLGSYLDVAVMAPVHPQLHETPLLLAGADGEAVAALLRDLDMDVVIAGPTIGDATLVKMIRSVMIKGLEALSYECFAAARRANVQDTIIRSLDGSFPGLDWEKLAAYNVARMLEHGLRRSSEMDEVAATLSELGIAPTMTSAATQIQRSLGSLRLQPSSARLEDLLDQIDGNGHASNG